MRKIDKHITPLEPFCIWGAAFTDEECDKIVQLGELEEFRKGSIGGGIGVQQRTDMDVRDTDLTWLQPNPDTHWIFDRMNSLAAKINFDKYQLDLLRFDGFQYSKYQVGGHYDWHTDTVSQPSDGMFRKLSFSLMLTDVETFEGGDLLMNVTGRPEDAVHIRHKKGDLAVFYPFIPHKVEPVTSGTRITLVTWAQGPKIV